MKKLLLMLVFLVACDDGKPDKAEQLFTEISKGITGIHVYGGRIVSDDNIVIVYDVPSEVCVSVGWKLVKTGVLTINNITPQRVSAAKLSSLCYTNPTAEIKWQKY